MAWQPSNSRTQRLDELFDRWKRSYPEHLRDGFHCDGIVDEEEFLVQPERVLFMLKEPNSSPDGRFAENIGDDLRPIYGSLEWTKPCNQNVARWARCILDGIDDTAALSGKAADALNRRIAVMNLKKLSGGGVADKAAIAAAAWESRAFIREQLEIIDPTVVIACASGGSVSNLLYQILNDDRSAHAPRGGHWPFGRMVVVPSHHPSLRNSEQTKAAMQIIRERAQKARIGAFRTRSM